MSHDIGSRISTHSSAAKSIRIGQERAILEVGAVRSAGNAIVIMTAAVSSSPPDPPGCLYFEDLRVARLDLLARRLDRVGVLAHELDLGEFPNAGFFHDLSVRRILPGPI